MIGIGIGVGIGFSDVNRLKLGGPPANFFGKESGSVVENPHTFKWVNAASSVSLVNPSSGAEESNSNYEKISILDDEIANIARSASGQIAQQLFSFNLIEQIKRIYGEGVYGSATSTANRVTWLKANITSLVGNWWGRGTGPSGNRANLSMWSGGTGSPTWVTPQTNTSAVIARLVVSSGVGFANQYIDSNGFMHCIAYAEASDGTTASTIYTDYVELMIQI